MLSPRRLVLPLALVVLLGPPSLVAQQRMVDDETDLSSAAPPDFQLRFPVARRPLLRRGHWSFELGPGAFVIRNGILYEKGTSPNRPLVVTGVAEQPPSDLLASVARSETLNAMERGIIRSRWLEWYARYFGRDLRHSDRERLVLLYKGTAAEADSLILVHATRGVDKLSSSQREELQREIVRVIAGFLVAERRIFGDNSRAQTTRYRRSLRPLRSIDDDTRKQIENELDYFLSGRYIAADESRGDVPAKADVNTRYRFAPAGRMGAIVPLPYPGTPTGLPPAPKFQPPEVPLVANNKCVRVGTQTQRTVEGPVAIANEGRVFVAEHPITGGSWEDIGLEHLYHTSVVGGLWEVVQKTQRSTTYSCANVGDAPTIRGRSEAVTTQSQFNRWVVADGCAGTYKSSDELTPVYVFGGEGTTASEVVKVLRGVRADGNGKRCRTRYAGFPNGSYGLNWVCHQNCNGFAHTKWHILPISYVVSYAPFGDLGNLGITDIRAPCECGITNGANHACVPGKNCCYNYTYGGGSGWGYGLSVGWHPTKSWIDTEAKFNSRAVPIAGADGEVVYIDISSEVYGVP